MCLKPLSNLQLRFLAVIRFEIPMANETLVQTCKKKQKKLKNGGKFTVFFAQSIQKGTDKKRQTDKNISMQHSKIFSTLMLCP